MMRITFDPMNCARFKIYHPKDDASASVNERIFALDRNRMVFVAGDIVLVCRIFV